jgi:hypothetical protein
MNRSSKRKNWRKRQKYFQREAARISSIKVPHGEFLPDVTQLLWASNEFFTGGAVFERKQGFWRVTQCAPCLSFLRKLSPTEAKFALAQRGYDWKWISPLSKENAVAVSPTDQGDLSRAINYGARINNLNGLTLVQGEGRTQQSSLTASNPATAALQH